MLYGPTDGLPLPSTLTVMLLQLRAPLHWTLALLLL
jgi:hypothetical protein